MVTQSQSTTIPFVNEQQPGFYPFQTNEPLLQSLQRTHSLLIVGSLELHHWIIKYFSLSETVVQQASSAYEAYQTVIDTQIDLIISDIDLPDESGWLMAAKLQISHPATQVWLHVDRETAIKNRWSGITFADQLVCTDKFFQSPLRKCS